MRDLNASSKTPTLLVLSSKCQPATNRDAEREHKRQEKNSAVVLEGSQKHRDHSVAIHISSPTLCEEYIRFVQQQHTTPAIGKRESLLQVALYQGWCLTNVTFDGSVGP